MNTKIYRPSVDRWPPTPGDTMVWKEGVERPSQLPAVVMVLWPLRAEDKSSEVTSDPKCLRCAACLTYESERIRWVCSGCGNVPSTEELRETAINNSAHSNSACMPNRPIAARSADGRPNG